MPRKRVSDVALRRTFRSAIVMPFFPRKQTFGRVSGISLRPKAGKFCLIYLNARLAYE
jgi:hypothetical protein